MSSSTCYFWYPYIWYHWGGGQSGFVLTWSNWWNFCSGSVSNEASTHQVEAAGSETATFNLWIKLNIDSNSLVLGDLWRDVTDLQPGFLTEFRKENKVCYGTLDDSARHIRRDLNRFSSITVPERRLVDHTCGCWGGGAVSPALWGNSKHHDGGSRSCLLLHLVRERLRSLWFKDNFKLFFFGHLLFLSGPPGLLPHPRLLPCVS